MYTKENILQEINLIFRDVLDNSDIVLNEKSSGDDVEEWDSLSHIQLVVAIEKHFRVRFTSLEIINFRNIGDLCDGIFNKLLNQ